MVGGKVDGPHAIDALLEATRRRLHKVEAKIKQVSGKPHGATPLGGTPIREAL